jgi:O-antigen/teichoic acid export membrane protein
MSLPYSDKKNLLQRKNEPIQGFVRSLSVFFVSRVISAIGLFGIGVLTARLLGVADRGYYTLFFTIVGISSNALNPGLSQANTYFLNKRNIPCGVLLCNTVCFISIITAILGILIIIEQNDAINLINDALPVWLLWLAVITMMTEVSLSGLIYGSHLYAFQSRSIIIQTAILIGSTLLIIPVDANLNKVLGFRVVGSVLFFIWYFSSFIRYIKPVVLKFSLRQLIIQLRFGGRNWIQNLIGLLNYKGYILILGIISGPESMAIFSIALLCVETVRFFPDTVGTLLLPKLVGLNGSQDESQLVAKSIRLIAFAMLVLSGVLYICTPLIVKLVFGLKYINAVLILQIMLPGAFFSVFYQILSRYFTSQSKQFYTIFSGVIGLFTASFLTYYLAPKYGTMGAAFAFTLSSLMTSIAILIAFKYQSGLSLFRNVLIVKSNDLSFVRSKLNQFVNR